MKKTPTFYPACLAILLMVAALTPAVCSAQIAPGATAPYFSLSDTEGKAYSLSQLGDRSLLILFFCDVESEISRQALLNLIGQSKQLADAGVTVWVVTQSPKEQVLVFTGKHRPPFPILLDAGGVSELYDATVVVPSAYIVESGSKIVQSVQGAGKTPDLRIRRFVKSRDAGAIKTADGGFDDLKRDGIKAFEQRRYDVAAQSLSRALGVKSDRDAYLYLAQTYVQTKEDYKLEKLANEAVNNYPSEPKLWEVYIKYLADHDRKLEAKAVLDRAIQANPQDSGLSSLKNTLTASATSTSGRDAGTRTVDTASDRLGSSGKSDDDAGRLSSLPQPRIRSTGDDPARKARELYDLAVKENKRLKWDECLADKAFQRAKEMVKKGYFEHKDPKTGKNPSWNLVAQCHKIRYAGENLSRGKETARVIHEAWMKSSDHRKNILNKQYGMVGVACHEEICVELFAGL